MTKYEIVYKWLEAPKNFDTTSNPIFFSIFLVISWLIESLRGNGNFIITLMAAGAITIGLFWLIRRWCSKEYIRIEKRRRSD